MTTTKKKTQANRGMKFEEQIQNKCDEYKVQGVAYIDKLPTSWKVVRRGRSIVSAFPESKSKLDFYGTLKNGKSIYIEAKSSEDNALPLKNIKDHQFDYIQELSQFTDHVYLLIEMKKHDKVFLIEGMKVLEFKNTETRKSIPLQYLEQHGTLIEDLDFLSPLGY